jgi:predicted nucleic acid-binding protein
VLVDTGPLLAAATNRDRAHHLASDLLSELGSDLVVLEPVIVETDYMLRVRVGLDVARAFLDALVAGEHSVDFMTPGLLRRAVEFDRQYADLDLGITDGAVMAYAERHGLPILTFDFEHFRATRPTDGFWELIVDEDRYLDSIR